jgi:hypothetical protein
MQFMRVLACLALLTATAVASPIPPDKKDYIGQWAGHGLELAFSAEGTISYKAKDGAFTKSFEGLWDGMDGNFIMMNVLLAKKPLRVDEPPHQEQGVWVMTINGAKMLRTSPTPLRPSMAVTTRKERTENLLRADFVKKGVAVVKVTCPPEAETADTFACALAHDNSPTPLPVRVAIGGEKMQFIAPDVALLSMSKLRGTLAGHILGRTNDKVEVTCPTKGTTVAEKVGGSFVCTAKGTKTYQVKITVTSAAGDVNFNY